MEKNKKILLGGIIVTIITGAVLFCYLDENKPREGVVLLGPKVIEPLPDGSIPSPSLQHLDLSPEAIAKWPVCRNEKYGYEFKYPKGWWVSGTNPIFNENKTYPESGPPLLGVAACNSSFDITIFQKELHNYNSSQIRISILFQNKDVWDAIIRATKEESGEGRIFLNKEFIINGKKVIYYSDSRALGAGIFHKKDNLLLVAVSPIEQKLMDALVSTFKFID